MFAPSAALYDTLYAASGGDYAREATAASRLARDAVSPGATLLEVGCRAGGHLAAFERLGFHCEGIEPDLKLAALARSRLAEMAIAPVDDSAFALGRTFDVVVSLAGASSRVRTPERLDATIARMAAHLAPGGTLVVEPYLFFGVYRPGTLDSVFVDEPATRVARMSLSKQTGKIGIVDEHYLIATLQGVERYFERHERGLFSETLYREAFDKTGLVLTIAPSTDGTTRYVARSSRT